MTIELAPEAEAALDRMVVITGRSRDELAGEAMQRHAAWYEFEARKIAESKAAADRGEVIDHDELFDRLERRYAE